MAEVGRVCPLTAPTEPVLCLRARDARHADASPRYTCSPRRRVNVSEPKNKLLHYVTTHKVLKVRTQPIPTHKRFAARAAQTELGLADDLDTTTLPTRRTNPQKAQGKQSNPQNQGVGDHRQNFFEVLGFSVRAIAHTE